MFTRFENRKNTYDGFITENLTSFAHLHPHVELLLLKEGTLEITAGEHAYFMEKGDVAVIFPHVVHSYKSPSPSISQLLIFDAEIIPNYRRRLFNYIPEAPILKNCALHPDILYIFQRTETAETDKKILEGYLSVLTGRLLQSISLCKINTQQMSNPLRKLLLYMDRNFLAPLSLDKVAAEIGISKYHLSRYFSQKIGCSFTRYLNNLRAQHAMMLLRTTDLQLSEICYESGFESTSTFYRAFSSLYGMAPGSFSHDAL